MIETDEVHMLAGLAGTYCQLKHAPGSKEEDYPAVDYIVAPVGNIATEEEETKISIPVCQECAEALQGDEWTLVYCVDCLSSHWVLRAVARLNYRHHILWLKGCPDCGGKFGGLYFTDSIEGKGK